MAWFGSSICGLCRTYGARYILGVFPTLPGGAKLCRAYGTRRKERPEAPHVCGWWVDAHASPLLHAAQTPVKKAAAPTAKNSGKTARLNGESVATGPKQITQTPISMPIIRSAFPGKLK